jgi:hypothetical protein
MSEQRMVTIRLYPFCPICHKLECSLGPNVAQRDAFWVACWNNHCTYRTNAYREPEDAIQEHNGNVKRIKTLVTDGATYREGLVAFLKNRGLEA